MFEQATHHYHAEDMNFVIEEVILLMHIEDYFCSSFTSFVVVCCAGLHKTILLWTDIIPTKLVLLPKLCFISALIGAHSFRQ